MLLRIYPNELNIYLHTKTCIWILIVIVQSPSCIQLFVTPQKAAHQGSLTFTISWNFLKFISIEFMMLSNHVILCRPLLVLPSVFPSIRVFSDELALRIM